MDIDLYQNAFVDFGAIGQNFNIALQTAADFFTQGFNPAGEAGAGADVNADVQGPSSQVAADVNASLATSSNDTDTDDTNGGGLGLGLGLDINL
jgi:hypothetical protein